MNKILAVLLAIAIPTSTFLAHVILSLWIISWFLSGGLPEKVRLMRHHPAARVAFLFFGVFVIGSFYGEAPIHDRISFLEKMAKLLYIPLLMTTMQDAKSRQSVFLAFIVALLGTEIFSLINATTGVCLLDNVRTRGYTCVFKDDIFTNFMMAFASFMLAHYALSATQLFKKMGLMMLALLTAFYVLFISPGRSGYVIFFALGLLMLFQRLGVRQFKWLAVGILAVFLTLGITYQTSERFRFRWVSAIQDGMRYLEGDTKAETSAGLRLQFLTETLKLSKEHVWFGQGTGSFKSVYQKHAKMHQLHITQNPHNEYVNILFQLGLMGLTAFVAFLGFLYRYTFRLFTFDRWFAQGMLIAMAIGSLANAWLMDFTSGYFFVLILGICFGGFSTHFFQKDLKHG